MDTQGRFVYIAFDSLVETGYLTIPRMPSSGKTLANTCQRLSIRTMAPIQTEPPQNQLVSE
eukprot:4263239-Pyramimonas_sp.AAC.1